MDPLVVEDLTKRYGRVTAVTGVSFTVRAGEIVGLLGPNGAGKTTTMKVIAGLLQPTAGTVWVAGHNVQREPEAAKAALGYLPEQPFLYEKLTGREFLTFIIDLYTLSPPRVWPWGEALLEQFALQDALDDRIQSYSRGMRQKLALTAVLMRDPQVLVLDEPLTGLDPHSARAFKEVLRAACARGAAVLLSTHVLEVAERLCDRVAILHQGRLVAMGTIAELQAQSHTAGSTLEDLFLSLTASPDLAALVESLGD